MTSQEQTKHDVAVFVDFENIYISVRDKLDANPNFETMMERCTELGRVVIARAYADWYRYPRITSALYANGIDPIYVPTYHYTRDTGRSGGAIKNSADMHLCIDAMKTLFTHANIAKFVFVTGDRDFIPLVNSVRQQGKDVIIIGIGGAASAHLAQSADEFIFYEQLVGKPPAIVAQRVREGADGAKTDAIIEPDIYDTLVQAIHLVRERGYVSTLGSLKLVMKELMGGDFKESRYKDLKGRPFAKFKDFVVDAERRGKVQIYTSGTVNEVFLPGEDASKLSQFSETLKETPDDVPYDPTVPLTTINGRPQQRSKKLPDPPSPSVSPSRSRRRPRRSRPKMGLTPVSESLIISDELVEYPLDGEPDELVEEPIAESIPDIEEVIIPAPDELDPTILQDEEPAAFTILHDQQKNLSDDHLSREWERARSLLMEHESRSMTGVDDVFSSMHAISPSDDEMAAEPAAEDTPAEDSPDTEPIAIVAEESSLSDEPSPAPPPPLEQAPYLILEQLPVGPIAPSDTEIIFGDEEWHVFRTVVGQCTQPVTFGHIFDLLREARNQQELTRTNEQLRTMIKQAIQEGYLDRSTGGKSKQHVYYQLADQQLPAEGNA